MNRLRRFAAAVLVGLLVVVVIVIGVGLDPPAAGAGEPGLVVDAPDTATAGEIVEVRVTAVTPADEPAAGVTITVAYWAEFGGVGNWLELDRATTGEDGAATLTFEQRGFGTNEFRVEQLDPEGVPAESVTVDISETAGGPQLYASAAGVSIPWLNASAVIALVVVVWGVLVYAAVQLYLVSRPDKSATDEPDTDEPSTDQPVDDPRPTSVAAVGGDRGAVSIGPIIVLVIATIAVTMVIVVARNPLTHANLSGPDDYDRTDVAYLEEDQPYLGVGDTTDPDATGEDLFFVAGCAGCHGLDGEGGVGPGLVGELESIRRFTSEVRDGPDTMPAYTDDVLTDEQIQAVHDYLTELAPPDS